MQTVRIQSIIVPSYLIQLMTLAVEIQVQGYISSNLFQSVCMKNILKTEKNTFSHKEVFINTVNGGNYIL